MVVKGPNLSGNISGTDPLKDNRLLLQAEALDGSDEAKLTAAVVNELSKEISRILVSHPINAKRAAEGKNIANIVLLRGCGIRIEVCLFSFLCYLHGASINKIAVMVFLLPFIWCCFTSHKMQKRDTLRMMFVS